MSQEYQYTDLNEFIATTLVDDFDDYEYGKVNITQ